MQFVSWHGALLGGGQGASWKMTLEVEKDIEIEELMSEGEADRKEGQVQHSAVPLSLQGCKTNLPPSPTKHTGLLNLDDPPPQLPP